MFSVMGEMVLTIGQDDMNLYTFYESSDLHHGAAPSQAAKMASARYGVQLAEEPIFLTWVTSL